MTQCCNVTKQTHPKHVKSAFLSVFLCIMPLVVSLSLSFFPSFFSFSAHLACPCSRWRSARRLWRPSTMYTKASPSPLTARTSLWVLETMPFFSPSCFSALPPPPPPPPLYPPPQDHPFPPLQPPPFSRSSSAYLFPSVSRQQASSCCCVCHACCARVSA